MEKKEFAEQYAPTERRLIGDGNKFDFVPTPEFYIDLNSVIRAELIRYKIWENIFGGNYDTLEPMVDEYLKSC